MTHLPPLQSIYGAWTDRSAFLIMFCPLLANQLVPPYKLQRILKYQQKQPTALHQ